MKHSHTKRKPTISLWLLSIIFIAGCAEEVVTETPLRPVKQYIVESGADSARKRVFSGTANAAEEADLSFKVAGTVESVFVEVGDSIKPGDKVAELDPVTYKVELEQAKASAAKSKASLRSAESEYNRVRQLYTNDNASLNELDNALADSESAKADQKADLQSVQLAKLNLGYTRLTIGAACKVSAVNVEPNENVQLGQTIAEVSCGDAWEVKIAVPESLIGLFKRSLSGFVQFPALPGKSYGALVTEVGVGKGDGATFPVTFLLNDTPSAIRSNLAAEVTLSLDTNDASNNSSLVYVPASAVVKDEKGTFVYVLGQSDKPNAAKVERRAVEVGELSSLGLQINSGLSKGDRIMVAGQINARDGMLVRNQ